MAKPKLNRAGTSKKSKNLQRQMDRDPKLAARIEAEEQARREAASMKKGERKDFLAAQEVKDDAAVKRPSASAKSNRRTTPQHIPKRATRVKTLGDYGAKKAKRRRIIVAVIAALIVSALIAALSLTLLPQSPETMQDVIINTDSVINNITMGS